ncbi:hypothetical protein Dalk_5042 [Desulfatibacillum aliphaticivorans]|uniref:Uncharacterized protein n=1 Tax=Desulfatibacillum aliphaticivorans TaxID=218208 RepID=B8FDT2_DESAL|nr:hypothetical protein [Desulfatibacillum aliphaticivorans]ACL06713.1 hypothetical protein Dalk_5042 [Desulfatibacillum aliphaticivorans]
MKVKILALTLFLGMCLVFVANAGQDFYFDPYGNQVSEKDYYDIVRIIREQTRASREEAESARLEREKAMARARHEKWAAEKAAKQAEDADQDAQQGADDETGAVKKKQTLAGLDSNGKKKARSYSDIDFPAAKKAEQKPPAAQGRHEGGDAFQDFLSNRQEPQAAGAEDSLPPGSLLNLTDCYTLEELEAKARRVWTQGMGDDEAPEEILVGKQWRAVIPCGAGEYRLGRVLPRINLNPDGFEEY